MNVGFSFGGGGSVGGVGGGGSGGDGGGDRVAQVLRFWVYKLPSACP